MSLWLCTTDINKAVTMDKHEGDIETYAPGDVVLIRWFNRTHFGIVKKIRGGKGGPMFRNIRRAEDGDRAQAINGSWGGTNE